MCPGMDRSETGDVQDEPGTSFYTGKQGYQRLLRFSRGIQEPT